MTFPTDPLVVLIHGAGHDRRIWWAVTLGLSRLGWQVSAPDLPGHGADERAPCPTIEEYAAALAAGLDAERPVVAVGHSMGSLVALELAARLIKGNQCPGFDLLAIFQSPAEQLSPVAPHHAADLGGAVLEREIHMAGGGVGQVRYFATDPGQREGGFEAVAHQAVEAGNAEDLGGGGLKYRHAAIVDQLAESVRPLDTGLLYLTI